MSVRRPTVAGQFYPGDPHRLMREVERLLQTNTQPQKAIGVVAPHAGYMYSGQVAGALFSNIQVPQKVIILGPNHTGLGPEASIMDEGKWEMPMGNVEIDQQLAQIILNNADKLESDTQAHEGEHSLEVQVPFLQYLQPKLQIVPIVLGGYDFSVCQSVAQGIVAGIKGQEEDVLIVASTDLTHYQTQKIANQQDTKVIEKIKALDAQGLHELILQERISMCGFMPVITMILAARTLGATKAKLIKYMTSGDTSGDYNYVVGYAGILVN